MKRLIFRLFRDLKRVSLANRKVFFSVVIIVAVFAVYVFASARDEKEKVFYSEKTKDIKPSKILDVTSSRNESYENGGVSLLKKLDDLKKESEEKILSLTRKVESLEAKVDVPKEDIRAEESKAASVIEKEKEMNNAGSPSDGAMENPPHEDRAGGAALRPKQVFGGFFPGRRESIEGPSILNFPVKGEERRGLEIALPVGSYVKAMLMTGVEAPEGSTYPVLLQLDFAYVLPNRKKLDLSGCFMIGKAEGDLSIERVKMQATKLSCVGRDGHMFERDINGFVADDMDNSFAVTGSVNSKQDRVAAMAFLSSVVEGISKAIQQAQVSQESTAFGGHETTVTGNQGKYIAAGGAGSAASTVTQWYLKQAQSLLPTINVGSGRTIWIVMSDSVDLPKRFFKKPSKKSGVNTYEDYSFVTRILD